MEVLSSAPGKEVPRRSFDADHGDLDLDELAFETVDACTVVNHGGCVGYRIAARDTFCSRSLDGRARLTLGAFSMTDPTAPQTPAGWYPAPQANGELRYWNGVQWLEPAVASTPPAVPTDTSVPKKKLKWWAWVLIALGALIVVGGIGSALGGGSSDEGAAVAPTKSPSETVESTPEAPVMVSIPDFAGQTADAAASALSALGLKAELTTNGDATVTATDPAAGTSVEEGATVKIIATEKPQLSVSQQNAVRKAEQYLNTMAFSRQGLIDQLVYEGYPIEDATFGVDYPQTDWNAQAAAKAQNYLDTMPFSRQSLIEQLVYEGFSQEQAEFGVAAVGL